MLSRFSYCYFMLLFSLWCQWWGGTLYGLRNIFSLLNTCCWRTKHKILIHDGESWCELINLYTVCPTTRVFVFSFFFFFFFGFCYFFSDISPSRKNYFSSYIIRHDNARILRRLHRDSFEVDVARSKMLTSDII